jgi:cyanate lyase
MTVSKLTLQKNLTDALILMVKTVGDRELNSVSFNPLEPQFENILKTTWTDLENERYVTPNHEQDNEYYTLLPKGWLRGIQEAELDNDPFKQRLHELSKVLKAKVKALVEGKAVGRHRALAGTEELAKLVYQKVSSATP